MTDSYLPARVEAGKYVQASVPVDVVRAAWADAQNMLVYMPERALSELRVSSHAYNNGGNPFPDQG